MKESLDILAALLACTVIAVVGYWFGYVVGYAAGGEAERLHKRKEEEPAPDPELWWQRGERPPWE